MDANGQAETNRWIGPGLRPVDHFKYDYSTDMHFQLGPAPLLIPPNNRLLPVTGGGLPGRIVPSPTELFMLATAPPILTPGDIKPAAPELEPEPPAVRFGFNGEMPEADRPPDKVAS